jgi:glutamine synthetase
MDSSEYDRIRLFWTDLNGIARGISVPSDVYEETLEEGTGFANGVAELTLEPGLLDDPRYGAEGGDMVAMPDPDSLRDVAWAERTGASFTDLLNVDGTPFDLCARSALRRVVDDLAEEGFVPYAGVEAEFSLLEPDGEGDWRPYNTRCSYDMTALDMADDLLAAWSDAIEATGVRVLGVHQESQPGQYEINVEHDDALSTADTLVFLRHAIKAIAHDRGYKASFMPRPYSGEDANGLHFHLSLWDTDGEENLFASETGDLQFPAGKRPAGDAGLSETARHFVGGLLDHMQALTAICAPTVNSYRRLLPGIWAPVNVAWGPDNRSTVLRIPPELGHATRIENRVPDSSCNPYLGLAATLAAGLDGIRNETDPGAPTTNDAYDEDYDSLPRTLWDALEELEADTVITDALGEPLVEEFLKLKREEFDRYMDAVTEWEREEYRDEF